MNKKRVKTRLFQIEIINACVKDVNNSKYVLNGAVNSDSKYAAIIQIKK